MRRALGLVLAALAAASVGSTCGVTPVGVGSWIVSQQAAPGGLVDYELAFVFVQRGSAVMHGVRGVARAGSGAVSVLEGELILGDMWPSYNRGSPDTILVRAAAGRSAEQLAGALVWNFREPDALRYEGGSVGTQGGQVAEPDGRMGAVFGAGFASPPSVLLYLVQAPAELARFAESALPFEPSAPDPFHLIVQVSGAPRGPSVRVWFTPSAAPGRMLWARVQSGAEYPSALLDQYLPVESSLELSGGRLQGDVPTAAFKDIGGGVFEAVVVAAAPALQPKGLIVPVSHVCPLSACQVTRGFSTTPVDHPLFAKRPHYGDDFKSPTPESVFSSAAGVVIRSDAHDVNGFGNVVMVRHADGSASTYAHLSRRDVFLGDVVPARYHLGYSGQTGGATGPHLHYELVLFGVSGRGGLRVDPVLILLPPPPPPPRRVTVDARQVGFCSSLGFNCFAWGVQNVILIDGELYAYFGQETWGTAAVDLERGSVHEVRLGYQFGQLFGPYMVEAFLAGASWVAVDAQYPADGAGYDLFQLWPAVYPLVWPVPESVVYRTFLVSVPQ